MYSNSQIYRILFHHLIDLSATLASDDHFLFPGTVPFLFPWCHCTVSPPAFLSMSLEFSLQIFLPLTARYKLVFAEGYIWSLFLSLTSCSPGNLTHTHELSQFSSLGPVFHLSSIPSQINNCLPPVSQDWTSLVAQWLGLHASDAGGTGSIPGWGSSACLAVQLKQNTHFSRRLKCNTSNQTCHSSPSGVSHLS